MAHEPFSEDLRSPPSGSPPSGSPGSGSVRSFSREVVGADARLPLQPGEVVLELGSGDGRLSLLAASIVGPGGRVVGVEDDLAALARARRAADLAAARLGYANVDFVRGRCDDLALDPERLDAWLEHHPVRSADDMTRLAGEIARLRRAEPLIPDESFDVVITQLDLERSSTVPPDAIAQGIARVLRDGGRFVSCESDHCDVVSVESLDRGPTRF